jgi:hemerythrin
MAFFEWHDSYLTHISRLDAHHKKLVTLINNLYIDVLNEPNISQKQPLIEKALAELIDYSYYHFAAEEELMLKYRYPGFMLHKEEHEQFKLQVSKMMKQHKTGDLAWTFPILDYLKYWLNLHVINTDKQYGTYFSEENIEEY